jgi:hypothetical protein
LIRLQPLQFVERDGAFLADPGAELGVFAFHEATHCPWWWDGSQAVAGGAGKKVEK